MVSSPYLKDTYYFMGDVISQGKLQTKHVDKQLKAKVLVARKKNEIVGNQNI